MCASTHLVTTSAILFLLSSHWTVFPPNTVVTHRIHYSITLMATNLSILFALLFSLTMRTNSSPLGSPKKFCRKQEGDSLCVEPPLEIGNVDDWCPYRRCAPSYLESPKCSDGPDQATHKCIIVTFRDEVYRCIDATSHKLVDTPINCNETDSCTEQINICKCEKHMQERVILTPQIPNISICN